jgi:Flp pilus assembly protein TadG
VGGIVTGTTRQRRVARAVARAVARWHADERGAAVVEFAIVVPVLLTVVMAILDFGRMMAVSASLAAAVRDGARQAATASTLAVGAAERTAVQNRVVSAFQPFGGQALTAAQVAVTLTANDEVVVTVTGYAYQPITPIASMIGLGTISFNRSATFRWERGA